MTILARATAALLLLAACRNADSAPLADAKSAAASPAVAAPDVTPGVAPGVAPASPLAGFSLYDLGSSWRDQRGDSLTLEGLAGPVRIIALVYTSCHGTCPIIVNDMKRIEAALPAGREGGAGFVLISLDPARDTPGRLAQWAADNDLDQRRWTLLNGTDAAVREIAATLGVRYQVQPDGEVAHANVITVVDRAGTVVHQQVTLGDETLATSALVNRLLSP